MVSRTARDRLEGRGKQVKGKAKEVVGRATGDDRLEASGAADGARGKAQALVGDAADKVRNFTRKVSGKK